MSFLKRAATYYVSEPHQEAAWDDLESKLPKYLLEEFQAAYSPSETPSEGLVILTEQTFEDLTGYSAALFTEQEVSDCNQMLKETGFGYDPELTSMLMANILHETMNLKYMKEIADGWAYEGRSDLGNVQSGDGPRYKGSGILMLTGRFNYSRLSKALADPQVMKGVDYVASTYPFRSAVPWISENRLLDVAKTEGFEAVCVRINGGYNGYEDRKTKYKICREVFC